MQQFNITPSLIKHLLLLVFGIFLPLLAAGEIADEVLEGEGFRFERELMLLVHRHTAETVWVDAAVALHWLGSLPAATVISLLLAAYEWGRRRRDRAVLALSGTAVSAAIMFLAKQFFDRPRPELWPRLVADGSTASFPSGHSTFAAALAVTVILLCWHKPYRWPVVVLASSLAVLAGFSRVVLGVHYPTDVLVGWITGMTTVVGVYQIMRGRWQIRRLV